jgi:uracil-DNA glycosylase
VHGLLDELGAERRVILWNTVPTHPHLPGRPLSNRRPVRAEILQGLAFARRLIDIVQPRLLVGVGRIATEALDDRAVYVRHPAQSGATAFRTGMRDILTH